MESSEATGDVWSLRYGTETAIVLARFYSDRLREYRDANRSYYTFGESREVAIRSLYFALENRTIMINRVGLTTTRARLTALIRAIWRNEGLAEFNAYANPLSYSTVAPSPDGVMSFFIGVSTIDGNPTREAMATYVHMDADAGRVCAINSLESTGTAAFRAGGVINFQVLKPGTAVAMQIPLAGDMTFNFSSPIPWMLDTDEAELGFQTARFQGLLNDGDNPTNYTSLKRLYAGIRMSGTGNVDARGFVLAGLMYAFGILTSLPT